MFRMKCFHFENTIGNKHIFIFFENIGIFKIKVKFIEATLVKHSSSISLWNRETTLSHFPIVSWTSQKPGIWSNSYDSMALWDAYRLYCIAGNIFQLRNQAILVNREAAVSWTTDFFWQGSMVWKYILSCCTLAASTPRDFSEKDCFPFFFFFNWKGPVYIEASPGKLVVSAAKAKHP